MKAKVNLTIESDVLDKAKKYAANMGTSVSEIVENYFRKLTATEVRESNLFKLIESLEQPNIAADLDFKKAYHEAKINKNGL